MAFKNYF